MTKERTYREVFLKRFPARANPVAKFEIHLSFHALLRMLVLVVMIQTLALSVAGQAGEPAESTATENEQASAELEEKLRRWIRQLDADRFADRELATNHLVTAGLPAIRLTKEAADGSSLEVTTRAVYILQRLALDENSHVQEAARQALIQLATGEDSAAQRGAAKSLARLTSVWQEAALNELELLGAELHKSSEHQGFNVVDVVDSIRIGPQWRGELEGLKHLVWLEHLDRLTVSHPEANDQWLTSVLALKNLKYLHLNRTKVTDQGIAQLRALDHLHILKIWFTPVSDNCLDDLAAQQQLEKLELYGTAVSLEAVQDLITALAEDVVDYKRGGLLGVGCARPPNRCLVQHVEQGTAAAEAGLRVNDIILSYDGQKVTDFNGLRQLISTHLPGRQVQVVVQRGEKKLTKQVTLGAWQQSARP
ncbi:MAG: hypothetical protein CMJ81_22385 [Planctomycetaceae bacterium]|nr:hypothetical protein [Planctomycetaceae bacterium]MBP62286.1 hypothetical protein [Planctomycetaceae bacterium]